MPICMCDEEQSITKNEICNPIVCDYMKQFVDGSSYTRTHDRKFISLRRGNGIVNVSPTTGLLHATDIHRISSNPSLRNGIDYSSE